MIWLDLLSFKEKALPAVSVKRCAPGMICFFAQTLWALALALTLYMQKRSNVGVSQDCYFCMGKDVYLVHFGNDDSNDEQSGCILRVEENSYVTEAVLPVPSLS